MRRQGIETEVFSIYLVACGWEGNLQVFPIYPEFSKYNPIPHLLLSFILFLVYFLFRKKICRVFFVQFKQKLHAVGISGKGL